MIPECESSNVSDWISFAIPLKYDKTPEQCTRYKSISGSCTPASFNRSDVVTCEKLTFETEEVTIANEWDITCERNKWKLTLVGTINNLGQFFCLPITGYVSDQ